MESMGLYFVVYFLVAALIFRSPVWMLIAFAAYSIGRRTFSLRALFVLLTLEAVALAYIVWWVTQQQHR